MAYSILIVSADSGFNSVMADLLPEKQFYPVKYVSSVAAAQRDFSKNEYDFIMLNSPLHDGNGIRFCNEKSSKTNAIVMLIVKGELYFDVCRRVSGGGVFVLSKPMSKQSMTRSLMWMLSAKRKMKTFEKRAEAGDDKKETLDIVNKAKWLLIEKEKMTEPEAHRFLEKQAMKTGLEKKNIALEVIEKYKNEA